MATRTFSVEGSTATFELFHSKDGAFKVRVADSDESAAWDYEDCEHARDMTGDLKGVRSWGEACEILFLGSDR